MILFILKYLSFIGLFISLIGVIVSFYTQGRDLTSSVWPSAIFITAVLLTVFTGIGEIRVYIRLKNSPLGKINAKKFFPEIPQILFVVLSFATVLAVHASISATATLLAVIALIFGSVSAFPTLSLLLTAFSRGGAGLSEDDLK